MPGGNGQPAPALGADTDALLETAGIGPAERERLRAAGVI
jgi:crotonobetainyl-CoA:carnitine CoA-transferase CaiB-like acyl-CoA transferase